MSTLNDVIDYSKFYNGKDEPPFFYHEYFDLKNKLFVPSDDFKLAQKLTDNVKENVVLHYFERIIKMQTRTELLHLLEKRNAEEKQLRLAV